MKIENIYIGGWFQRTTLQLSEIYDFLKYAESELDLDKKKLVKLRDNLNISRDFGVSYHVEGLECLKFSTNDNINIKIFEDGLIVINKKDIESITMFKEIDSLAEYYEKKLSPAISYIFSLGAPVPKELANIEKVYPYFIVLKDGSREEIDNLIAKTENEKYFEFNNDSYEVYRGDKYYFINNKTKTNFEVERYVEEQIFIREFKAQLHRYLNIHRIIWEKIADVKENATISGKDIITYNTKIEGYSKTINLIDARINQMSTYLKTREKIAKGDESLKEALNLIGYRYETLGNTLSYMQQLWKMTQNYVNSATSLFKKLQSDVTNKSLSNLTIVTSVSAGVSIISLLTKEQPQFTSFGVLYFLILALIVVITNHVLKYISKNRTYEINDIEYDKDIK